MRFTSAIFPALLLAAVSAFGQTVTPGTQTSTTSLPPVGLAATETVQVNVVNTAPASPTGVAASCTGSISFYSAAGSLIGSATPFTVTNGQIFSAKLPYNSAEAAGARAEIRAEISLTFNGPVAVSTGPTLAPALPPPCVLVSSLETYDTETGVTHVFVSGGSPQAIVGRLANGRILLPAQRN